MEFDRDEKYALINDVSNQPTKTAVDISRRSSFDIVNDHAEIEAQKSDDEDALSDIVELNHDEHIEEFEK